MQSVCTVPLRIRQRVKCGRTTDGSGPTIHVMERKHNDDGDDPRLGGEPRGTVDWLDEGFDEDTEPAGDDVGTI